MQIVHCQNSSEFFTKCSLHFSFNLYCGGFILFCNVCVCACVCVCVRACFCGFCIVCVCAGFEMCGCFGNMYTVL